MELELVGVLRRLVGLEPVVYEGVGEVRTPFVR